MRTWLKIALGVLVSNVSTQQVYEYAQKNIVYNEARKYAQLVGKPILDFGCGWHPRGDINMDITPRQNVPNFMPMPPDSQRLPFEDKTFSSALAFHVLEHVNNPKHVKQELQRVADRVYIITPSPIFLYTWLHQGHRHVFLTENVYFKNPLKISPMPE